ncbi:MAG: PaaX family transcriptional regulator C-terminal domain-containing protein [Patescibacteria group bacterium]
MKKIKLTDILLLSIAGFLDIFQEMKDPGRLFSSYYQNFYGFVPDRWKRQNYYALVAKLIADKKISKSIKNNHVIYQITTKGFTHLQKKRLLLNNQKRKWDKKWRIIIFDIEEENRNTRDLLRIKIKELGFGLLQKSVWVSPYNVFPYLKKFINDNGLKNKAVLIESQKISIKNYEIADLIWPIKKIENNYRSIYKKLTQIKKSTTNKKKIKILKKSFDKTYKELVNQILKDPHLPKELLPKHWPQEKTIKIAKILRNDFTNKN